MSLNLNNANYFVIQIIRDLKLILLKVSDVIAHNFFDFGLSPVQLVPAYAPQLCGSDTAKSGRQTFLRMSVSLKVIMTESVTPATLLLRHRS
jgi:hypothetical protein